MAIFRADIEQLEQVINMFGNIIPQLISVKSGITEIEAELTASWDGEASRYFIEKLHSHALPLSNIQDVLAAYQKQAVDGKNRLEALDRALQQAEAFISGAVGALSSQHGGDGRTHGSDGGVGTAAGKIAEGVKAVFGGK